MTRRTQRVSELLRQEISLVLQRQLRDPRLNALISITKVDTSDDLRHSKVYISVLGDTSNRDTALHGLVSAAGYVRRELGDTLALRRIPTLEFVLDESLERVEEVLKVMDQLSDEDGSPSEGPRREPPEHSKDDQDGQN